jgi:hypothetical protein
MRQYLAIPEFYQRYFPEYVSRVSTADTPYLCFTCQEPFLFLDGYAAFELSEDGRVSGIQWHCESCALGDD